MSNDKIQEGSFFPRWALSESGGQNVVGQLQGQAWKAGSGADTARLARSLTQGQTARESKKCLTTISWAVLSPVRLIRGIPFQEFVDVEEKLAEGCRIQGEA